MIRRTNFISLVAVLTLSIVFLASPWAFAQCFPEKTSSTCIRRTCTCNIYPVGTCTNNTGLTQCDGDDVEESVAGSNSPTGWQPDTTSTTGCGQLMNYLGNCVVVGSGCDCPAFTVGSLWQQMQTSCSQSKVKACP